MADLALSTASAELVTRARLGDQNARAMIVEVAKAAKAGIKRAQAAFAALKDYIDRHPAKDVRQTVGIGAEEAETLSVLRAVPDHAPVLLAGLGQGLAAVLAAVILLADGPPLTRDRLDNMSAVAPTTDAQQAFIFGAVHAGHPNLHTTLTRALPPAGMAFVAAGEAVGMARKLQIVRLPHTKISGYCADTAWELGE
jgi:hypothetical protein